jgi:hypothetical protein
MKYYRTSDNKWVSKDQTTRGCQWVVPTQGAKSWTDEELSKVYQPGDELQVGTMDHAHSWSGEEEIPTWWHFDQHDIDAISKVTGLTFRCEQFSNHTDTPTFPGRTTSRAWYLQH